MPDIGAITRRGGLGLGLALGLSSALPAAAKKAADPAIMSLAGPGYQLGEGPIWSPRHNAVFFVDILGKELHRYDLTKRQVTQSFGMPDLIGWVVERQKGGFVVGVKNDVWFLDIEPFKLTRLTTIEADKPGNRLNDAKADPKGRLWTGTMDLAFKDRTAALYRIDPDLSVHVIDTGYVCTNGPAFSKDGTRMYHNETHDGIVYVYDIAADGSASNRRVFAKFADGVGLPDGCTVDADDGLWVSHYGGGRVSRYRPDGVLDFDVMLPAKQTTSLTFFGPALDRLVVTSAAQTIVGDLGPAGTIFEVPKALLRGHKGLPPAMFAG
ncbi:MAG: SMP-30/gluconolactonase/LRE family protein [Asticcacaulis sp.]